MTDHPDLEALSAALDGDRSDATIAHLDGCAPCRERMAGLESVRRALSAPVTPAADVTRERAIAHALAAADTWGVAPAASAGDGHPPAPVPTPPSVPVSTPSRSRWLLASSAVAALLVLVLGTIALVRHSPKGSTNTALSAGVPSSDAAPVVGAAQPSVPSSPSASSSKALNSTADATTGDLGAVSGLDVLRAKVAAGLPPATAGPGPSTTVRPGAAPIASIPPSTTPVPNVVGTRVCEAEARSARPQLAAVVYAANLVYTGTPAVVLGFAATASDPQGALLVLAPQQGCRILAATTLP